MPEETEVIVMSEEEPVDKFSELEMEVFATGKWNGDKYADKELDEIIASYQEIGEQVKPYLKLGHNEEQELAKKSGFFKDGKPALGWMSALKKVGKRLVATFKDVPKVVAELVSKGAYKRVSSELFVNYERNNKKFPLVLKAVALLGADTPAITTLGDVAALYSEAVEEFKTVEFEEGFVEKEEMKGSDVTMEKEFEDKLKEETVRIEKMFSDKQTELEAKLNEQTVIASKYVEVAKMFEGVEDLKKAIADFNAEKEKVAGLEKQYTEAQKLAQEKEVKEFVDGLVAENKLMPVQARMLLPIMANLQGGDTELQFTQSELYGLKEKMTLLDTMKALFASYPDMGTLKEFAGTDRITSNPAEEAEALIAKFMEDKKVSYGEAQIAISKVRPELFGIQK